MGQGEGLGCCGSLAKFILFIVNLAVFLGGAVLLAIGIVLLVNSDAIDWISDITGGADLNDSLFRTAVYMMITIGALLFIIGFFGCCGACKENTCMLQMYVILVCLMLVLEVVVGVLAVVFIGEVDEKLEATMTTSVQTKYGVAGQNTTTVAWDAMQVDLECCGADTFQDYANSTYYQESDNIVPMSCCEGARIVDDKVEVDNYANCLFNAGNNTGQAYYSTGCYTKFSDWVDENSIMVIASAFAIAGVQLVSVCIGCYLKSSVIKSNKVHA